VASPLIGDDARSLPSPVIDLLPNYLPSAEWFEPKLVPQSGSVFSGRQDKKADTTSSRFQARKLINEGRQ
jgi:hypothetical protein